MPHYTPTSFLSTRPYPDRVLEIKKMTDYLQYILPNETEVVLLDVKSAFEGLTDPEKLYAHYLSRASWYGGLIVLLQTSPESPGIYLLLHRLYRSQSLDSLQTTAREIGLPDKSYQALLIYSAGFFANMGNYKSFGDTKFVPDLPKEELDKLIKASRAYKESDDIGRLWDEVRDDMYNLEDMKKQLGLGHKGISTYYSSNCGMHDATHGQEFLNHKNLSAYNTRLFKSVDGTTGEKVYEVRLASVLKDKTDDAPSKFLGDHKFTPPNKDHSLNFRVTRGDYSPLLALVAENLQKAKEHASNDHERAMLASYAESFTSGSIDEHKQGSRHWIKDKGPIVESYIGFIESYRDPLGSKGEFEGFVAVVNKEMSAKFNRLVEESTHFLSLLPWPTEYEKDEFLRPDFTSLDVLTFGGSGVPAGINIPNYDDIRQKEGFKNVSLGNVLSAGYKDSKVTFLLDKDKEVFSRLKVPSFEVQVGLHELLGHGSGKLFQKKEDGTLNFDQENTRCPLTNEKVTSWYGPADTYMSQFPVIGSSYEECRAECVGLYLCLSSEVLRIFGHDGDQADDVIYVNWLNMVRAGLLALEFYSPDKHMWRQAHMNARYVILRVLLEAGEGLVTITKTQGDDDGPDMYIELDRAKINSVGKPAIGKFLQKLQVYKAHGDFESAKAMYDHYGRVSDEEAPHFLTLREIALRRKQPRKMLVQCNTNVEGGSVRLTEYPNSACGLVQSFVDRFQGTEVDPILESLWRAEAGHHVHRPRCDSATDEAH